MATEKRLLIDYEMARNATYEEMWWTASEQAYVRSFLAKLPKVDAEEVVHGEWGTIEDDITGMTALKCSECNQEWWFEDEPPMKIYKYCPNCGAKMYGGIGNG